MCSIKRQTPGINRSCKVFLFRTIKSGLLLRHKEIRPKRHLTYVLEDDKNAKRYLKALMY